MSLEDDEFRKMYVYDEWVRNTEGLETDGQEKTVLLPSFKDMGPLLARLERLVHEIEFSKDSVGFETKRNALSVRATVPTGKRGTRQHFVNIKALQMERTFSERYIYSPHVSAIQEALLALEWCQAYSSFAIRKRSISGWVKHMQNCSTTL